jgi:hypothetical protein
MLENLNILLKVNNNYNYIVRRFHGNTCKEQ